MAGARLLDSTLPSELTEKKPGEASPDLVSVGACSKAKFGNLIVIPIYGLEGFMGVVGGFAGK